MRRCCRAAAGRRRPGACLGNCAGWWESSTRRWRREPPHHRKPRQACAVYPCHPCHPWLKQARMSDIVQKLWGFCHTLRHDGVDYGDYIEQLTYLLFLKMADEKSVELPKGCAWPALRDSSGTDLTEQYVDVLRTLGKSTGILGDIYAGAQSR